MARLWRREDDRVGIEDLAGHYGCRLSASRPAMRSQLGSQTQSKSAPIRPNHVGPYRFAWLVVGSNRVAYITSDLRGMSALTRANIWLETALHACLHAA